VHHHLYQWGHTSVFITIGGLKRKRAKKDSTEKRSDKLEVGFTIDERIADGYYLVNSLNHPEQLFVAPLNIKERPAKNKREYKKQLKENKTEIVS
jgi:hypothetical protein